MNKALVLGLTFASLFVLPEAACGGTGNALRWTSVTITAGAVRVAASAKIDGSLQALDVSDGQTTFVVPRELFCQRYKYNLDSISVVRTGYSGEASDLMITMSTKGEPLAEVKHVEFYASSTIFSHFSVVQEDGDGMRIIVNYQPLPKCDA